MLPKSIENKARYTQRLFSVIANRYDFLNTLLSFSQDKYWRRFALSKAAPRPGDIVLDVATGTGEIAFETKALKRKGNEIVIIGRMGVWDSEIYLSYGEMLKFFLGRGLPQIIIGLPIVLFKELFGRKKKQ